MRNWRLDLSNERADQLAYLFYLLMEHADDFLNTPLVDTSTRIELFDLMEWYEKAYKIRKAREAVESEFEARRNATT